MGATTRYQLGKNIGANICKPDIWLCRLAGISPTAADRFPVCMDLCRPLAAATMERIATVDSLLWLSGNKGLIKPGVDGRWRIDMGNQADGAARRRSIYEAGEA